MKYPTLPVLQCPFWSHVAGSGNPTRPNRIISTQTGDYSWPFWRHFVIFSISMLRCDNLEFTWKITSFSLKKNITGKISSWPFSVNYELHTIFSLYFYPQGNIRSSEQKWLSIYLKVESIENYDTTHHFKLFIWDAERKKFISKYMHTNTPMGLGLILAWTK